MAFKLTNPPYSLNNPPVYHVPLEEGVLGKADRNGSILINKDVESPLQEQDIINHEMVHINQMKRGWKGFRNYNDMHNLFSKVIEKVI